jgi:DNA-binding SARP family transcriptional activator/tetratricopeptide (TPR) repeat protein
MEFAILGPVAIRVAGQPVAAGHARQRAVLAVLLLELGRVVSPELLIDRVWGDAPPASVRNVLYGNIARLKSVLASAQDASVSLSRQPGGYQLRADPGQVDLYRFRRLVAEAGAVSGDDARAAQSLRGALGLWHGSALAGVASPWLEAMRHSLEMERAAAGLDLTDIRLRLGEHGALAAELAGQAADRPGDERLTGQLMLALYRDGKQAKALAAYQQARQVLVEELGAEPGPELQRLHQQILAADPALFLPDRATRAAAAAGPGRAAAPPRQLPAAVAGFTGRAAELAALNQLLEQADPATPGTVVISAIGGTAGVGKTALALHWAHQVADRFPDGQLYVNLRGFDPAGPPAEPESAIRGFLDALGVPPERIPATAGAQAGLYRDLLTDKRMLIVTDNARDEQQVRPLLPASPGSLVLVTSRSQLGGLAAADGARLVTLDVLTHAEAMDMLTARLGAARAAAEPDAVEQIAGLCACLPLALAVAAARAEARPGFPLAALVAELADSAGRLDSLDAGDPAASVRAVFSWSTRQLSADAARMFGLLGLHPGPDISVLAAASLAAVDMPEARRLLSELARAHLIAEHLPGRYAFHDLLRAYATDQAHVRDDQDERDAAVGRVLDHYLHTAAGAARLLNPAKEAVDLAPLKPGAAAGHLADRREALTWFEAEQQVLPAAVSLAADAGSDTHAWQIPWAMTTFQQSRGQYQEWAATQRTALAAATRLGDTAAQALSGRLLANACAELAEHDQARGHYASCLRLYQRLGDRHGEAKVHQNLCTLSERQGRYADALGHAEQALRLFETIGDKTSEAMALNGVGWCHGLLGDYQQARTYCRQALTLSAETGYLMLQAGVWDSLGYAEHHLSNLAEAAACYERSLSIARQAGNRFGQAVTLTHLGDTRHAAGEPTEAWEAWQQALAILDDLQHPDADDVRARLASAEGAPLQSAAKTSSTDEATTARSAQAPS